MTPLFIDEFAKQHKCNACKSKRVVGRKFCADHLRKAREHWKAWQDLRRKMGKCISCQRKSKYNWLRCAVHTNINRQRCREWGAEHYAERRSRAIAEFYLHGTCAHCGHEKATGINRDGSKCQIGPKCKKNAKSSRERSYLRTMGLALPPRVFLEAR